MKKLLLILIFIFLSGCSFNETREQSPDTVQSNKVNESNKEYELAVNSFTNISLQEAEKKISNNESFFLYIGRESCPYCQMFAPKLSDAISEMDVQIYYLNSEQVTDELEEFMMRYEIAFVPSFIHFQDNTNLRINNLDSENITTSDIKDFIQYSN